MRYNVGFFGKFGCSLISYSFVKSDKYDLLIFGWGELLDER